MKKFVTTTYTVRTRKLKEKELNLIMISDLHNVVFEDHNRVLFEEIEACRPDLILIAGDLVLAKPGASLEPALDFLREIGKYGPVYFGPGNHEQRMEANVEKYGDSFQRFMEVVKSSGIRYLNNEREEIFIKGEKVAVSGLALPDKYLKKGTAETPDRQEIMEMTGQPSEDAFEILLAHTPRYGKVYFQCERDLILSGHYHGGMVRLPGIGSVISPDFRLFPPYSCGAYTNYGKGRKLSGKALKEPVTCPVMITGAGLGEHTIPIRINNPRELICIRCLPQDGAKV